MKISERTKERINQGIRAEELLEPSPEAGPGMYCCPICGSGHGPHGTGALKVYPGTNTWTWYCHTCKKGGDVLKLLREMNGDNFMEAVRIGARMAGIDVELSDGTPVEIDHTGQIVLPGKQQNSGRAADQAGQPADQADRTAKYSRLIEISQEHAQDAAAVEYFNQRGLTADTVARFRFGYLPYFTASGGRKWKAVILPTGPASFTARNIEATGNKDRYEKRGSGDLWNAEALESGSPVFVVEGILDGASIEQAGGAAVAVGSLKNDKLLDLLEKHRPAGPLILAMDNDQDESKGTAAAEALEASLTEQDIFSYRPSGFYGPHKDANEFLVKEPAEFTKAVEEAATAATEAFREYQRRELTELEKESAAARITGFFQRTAAEHMNPIPTGFTALDRKLAGGLFPGLYSIGAVSSLGKTAFCLQIADYISKSGTDVLYISMEISADELMARSISRLTYTEALARGMDRENASDTREILNGGQYRKYADGKKALIQAAAAEYEKTAGHLYISEGVGDITAAAVTEKVKNHIRISGRRPVLIIDYLQILSPESDRLSDKQNIDKGTLILKRLSRDLHVPVLAISSFNRNSYNDPVSMASWKESGAVEYTSDFLAGLQYDGMAYQKGADGKAEKETDRMHRISELSKTNSDIAAAGGAQKVELVILKNRNGTRGTLPFFFWPKYNNFVERETESDGDEWEEVPVTRKEGRK